MSLLDWLNPWRRGGVRPHDAVHALITLAVLVALLLTSFGAGYRTAQSHYTAAYFRVHYANLGLRAPAPSSRTTAAPVRPAGTAAVSINLAHYPAVGDQGQQGACAAWAAAWALSYDYRMTHLSTHSGIRFSPAWLYAWYSDKYSGGQDVGSWPAQDLEMVPSIGVPQFSRYPAPQNIADPFPTPAQLPSVYKNAARYIVPVSVQTLYNGTPSAQVYDEIYAAIASGQPAIVALNVTPSWDNATQTGGNIWYTGPETSRGGHAVVALEVDPSHIMPDGSPGVLLQNQWAKWWSKGGRAWVSENWLAANAWGVLALQGVSIAGAGSSAADGGHVIQPPPPGLLPTTPAHGKYLNAVGHVWARDLSHFDLAKPINAAAKRDHLSAALLLATLYTECDLNTHSTQCDRVYPPYDVSFGAGQQIVSTAGLYGVGNGVYDGYYGANTTYVRNWENVPANSINLMARIYVDDRRITGVHGAGLHRAYNCGVSDMNPAPGSQCALNAAAFRQWYVIALNHLKRRT